MSERLARAHSTKATGVTTGVTTWVTTWITTWVVSNWLETSMINGLVALAD